jgi:hypothetical protein
MQYKRSRFRWQDFDTEPINLGRLNRLAPLLLFREISIRL